MENDTHGNETIAPQLVYLSTDKQLTAFQLRWCRLFTLVRSSTVHSPFFASSRPVVVVLTATVTAAKFVDSSMSVRRPVVDDTSRPTRTLDKHAELNVVCVGVGVDNGCASSQLSRSPQTPSAQLSTTLCNK